MVSLPKGVHPRPRHRYTIQDGDGDATFDTQIWRDYNAGVDQTHDMLGPNFTRAEAEVASWALNTVSQDLVLEARTRDGVVIYTLDRKPESLDYPSDSRPHTV